MMCDLVAVTVIMYKGCNSNITTLRSAIVKYNKLGE